MDDLDDATRRPVEPRAVDRDGDGWPGDATRGQRSVGPIGGEAVIGDPTSGHHDQLAGSELGPDVVGERHRRHRHERVPGVLGVGPVQGDPLRGQRGGVVGRGAPGEPQRVVGVLVAVGGEVGAVGEEHAHRAEVVGRRQQVVELVEAERGEVGRAGGRRLPEQPAEQVLGVGRPDRLEAEVVVKRQGHAQVAEEVAVVRDRPGPVAHRPHERVGVAVGGALGGAPEVAHHEAGAELLEVVQDPGQARRLRERVADDGGGVLQRRVPGQTPADQVLDLAHPEGHLGRRRLVERQAEQDAHAVRPIRSGASGERTRGPSGRPARAARRL